MNTTPRVVTRGIATDIRTSCVQGTSSPTASPQNAPAPAGRAADIVPHGPPGRPTGPPAGLSARFCQHGPVLIHPWDRPVSDQEWREVLLRFDFGQLIAPGGTDRDVPVVVPTHFLYDGDALLELHLARPNPVWRALAERPVALFTVVADYVYVPAAVNTAPDADPTVGVPTSYYAAVQARVDVEVVDDPDAKAELLTRQLAHFEPAGSVRQPVCPSVESARRQPSGIRGLRLTIRDVQAKFKYGGNKDVPHRLDIADALAARGGPMDDAARRRLLERTRAASS